MRPKDLELLKASIDKEVVLHCTDGEVIVAEIISVSDEDQDIIYDRVSSSRPEKYEQVVGKPACLIPFHEIDAVES